MSAVNQTARAFFWFYGVIVFYFPLKVATSQVYSSQGKSPPPLLMTALIGYSFEDILFGF